jgi:hypothetical protein
MRRLRDLFQQDETDATEGIVVSECQEDTLGGYPQARSRDGCLEGGGRETDGVLRKGLHGGDESGRFSAGTIDRLAACTFAAYAASGSSPNTARSQDE